MDLLERRSLFTAERVVAHAVGFTAGITSTLLVAWVPVSIFGRAIIFFGSWLSGFLLTCWTSRASTPARAIGRSAVSGAVQANVSATGLLMLAIALDPSHSGAAADQLGTFALAVAIIGSVLGVVVGALYSFAPSLVVSARTRPSHSATDRILVATATWLAFAALGHRLLVSFGEASRGYRLPIEEALLAASWSAPLALASGFIALAFVRMQIRSAFVARVEAGREPHYRVVPIEAASHAEEALPLESDVERDSCRSAIVRVADEAEDDREYGYRENATPAEGPPAIAIL